MTLLSGALPQPASSSPEAAAAATPPANTVAATSRAGSPMPAKSDLISALLPGQTSSLGTRDRLRAAVAFGARCALGSPAAGWLEEARCSFGSIVLEVLPELAVGDGGRQIAVAGGHQAQVGRGGGAPGGHPGGHPIILRRWERPRGVLSEAG